MNHFKNNISRILGTLLVLGSVTSHAGNEGRGGGDAFVCQEDGHERVYLADTYNSFSKPDRFQSQLLEDSLVQYLISSVAKTISTQVPNLNSRGAAQKIRDRYDDIDSRIDLVEGPLPDLSDDNIATPPTHCVKKQLAVQYFRTGRIQIDSKLLAKLEYGQDRILKLHETIIGLRAELGLDTTYTTETREVIAKGFERATRMLYELRGITVIRSIRDRVIALVDLLFVPNDDLIWGTDRTLGSMPGFWWSKSAGSVAACRSMLDGLAYVFNPNIVSKKSFRFDLEKNCADMTVDGLVGQMYGVGGEQCWQGHPIVSTWVKSCIKRSAFEATLSADQRILDSRDVFMNCGWPRGKEYKVQEVDRSRRCDSP